MKCKPNYKLFIFHRDYVVEVDNFTTTYLYPWYMDNESYSLSYTEGIALWF